MNGRTKYQGVKLCFKCTGGTDARRNRSNDDERSVDRKHNKSDRKQVHPLALNELVRPSPIKHDTPFDMKGRCHHHKEVKLAIRQFGEWKVLVETCPMCREDAIARSKSSKPRKSQEPKYVTRYDSDGFCINHPNVKVAKKKMTGSWKVISKCSKCAAKDDSASVYSTQTKDSRATSCSVKSNKSIRSRGSTRKSKGDDVSLVMQDGKATQGESHWSNVSSSKQAKKKPKGIKRFLLASIAM
ncbi:hypothetical protein ACHAWO_009539 [Cyclotella atomus]|uniref:Uncharacterized protein n=1 Tax=Cyclotella atomus TaxID=382360 RepID=A0ABD3PCB9_9STRA